MIIATNTTTTATLTGFNEETDDTQISAVPNALVLFNPVYDNGPDGYGHDRVCQVWETFSPLHNIRRNSEALGDEYHNGLL